MSTTLSNEDQPMLPIVQSSTDKLVGDNEIENLRATKRYLGLTKREWIATKMMQARMSAWDFGSDPDYPALARQANLATTALLNELYPPPTPEE